MGRERIPCCKKVGLNRGAWLPEEDRRLMAYIRKYGHPNWRTLPQHAGLLRCGKSCRLRWINYLRPNIKHGNFTKEEEETIIKLHEIIGNRWSKIASCLPGRTDNEIKNLWNTHLKKRLASKEVNPLTTQHKETPTSANLSDQGESKSKEMDSNPESRVKVHEKECSAEKIIIPFEPNLDMWDMVEDVISQPSSETESENINMWDGFSEKSSVSFESNPSKNNSEEPLNRCSSNSMYEIPDIIGAPESWNAMDASWSFVSELEAVVEFRSYIDSITLEENSSKEDEGNKWLAYLEKELDL